MACGPVVIFARTSSGRAQAQRVAIGRAVAAAVVARRAGAGEGEDAGVGALRPGQVAGDGGRAGAGRIAPGPGRGAATPATAPATSTQERRRQDTSRMADMGRATLRMSPWRAEYAATHMRVQLTANARDVAARPRRGYGHPRLKSRSDTSDRGDQCRRSERGRASTTRTCGCSSRRATRGRSMVSGNGCTRCTGPLARSMVVWPARFTRVTSAPLRHEVLDHLGVAARRRVMNDGVALVVERRSRRRRSPRPGTAPPPSSRPARRRASCRRSPCRSRRRPPPAAAECPDRRPESAAGSRRRAVRRRRRGRGVRSAGRIAGMCGSAPRATSSRIAATSLA